MATVQVCLNKAKKVEQYFNGDIIVYYSEAQSFFVPYQQIRFISLDFLIIETKND